MTDDPRIDAVLRRARSDDLRYHLYEDDAEALLAAADAADRAAGIVRVDTRDEATVERLRNTSMAWISGDAEDFVRAVLAGLPGLRGETQP